ncbi:hypothetical protein VNO78_07307 [Psophocarpus tetragonolobus]|uniref:Secreted protein n=1 Tax=Psophocarpus tetragonolobus TaxID=3891 RepID=A0AAN9XRT5_PSOTE
MYSFFLLFLFCSIDQIQQQDSAGLPTKKVPFDLSRSQSLASAPHPRFTLLGQFMLRRTPASCFRQSVVPYFENDTVRRNSNSFG